MSSSWAQGVALSSEIQRFSLVHFCSCQQRKYGVMLHHLCMTLSAPWGCKGYLHGAGGMAARQASILHMLTALLGDSCLRHTVLMKTDPALPFTYVQGPL